MFDGVEHERDMAMAGGNAASTSIRVRMFHEDRLVDRLVYPQGAQPRKRSFAEIGSNPSTPTTLEVFELADKNKKHLRNSTSTLNSEKPRGDTFLAM